MVINTCCGWWYILLYKPYIYKIIKNNGNTYFILYRSRVQLATGNVFHLCICWCNYLEEETRAYTLNGFTTLFSNLSTIQDSVYSSIFVLYSDSQLLWYNMVSRGHILNKLPEVNLVLITSLYHMIRKGIMPSFFPIVHSEQCIYPCH